VVVTNGSVSKEAPDPYLKENKMTMTCVSRLVLPSTSRYDDTRMIQAEIIDQYGNGIIAEGSFFQYFQGMLLPDKDFAAHVFGDTFLKCLGDSLELSSNVWHRVRKGLRAIATSMAGKAISHAFLGIKLSKSAGLPIRFVIFNGVYHGFVIFGPSVTYLFGKTINSVGEDVLRKEIKDISEHDVVLAKIRDILNAVLDKDGKPRYELTIGDINTSRKLGNVLFNITDEDMVLGMLKTQLEVHMSGLNFGDSYAVPNIDNVLIFLRFVRSGELGLLEDFPSFLDKGLLANRDRVYFGLAIFGLRVPTCNYGGDKMFTIPGINAIDTNIIAPVGGTRPLRYIPFRMVAHGFGVQHWRNLFETGKLMIPEGRKNKAEFTDLRDVHFQCPEMKFQETYDVVKDIVNMNRGSVSGSKRKREDNDTSKKAEKKRKEDRDLLDAF
jgi:hypothetical protein